MTLLGTTDRLAVSPLSEMVWPLFVMPREQPCLSTVGLGCVVDGAIGICSLIWPV